MFLRGLAIAAGAGAVLVGIRFSKNIMRSKAAGQALVKLNSLAQITVGGDGGSIWKSGFVTVPNTPAGFTVKNSFQPHTNEEGVTSMLEQWKAGSSEPPHSHPGDDMTVVVEGKMRIQYFAKDQSGTLQEDGPPVELSAGQIGYVKANRIHDAKYLEDCKLVYVHNGGFNFKAES